MSGTARNSEALGNGSDGLGDGYPTGGPCLEFPFEFGCAGEEGFLDEVLAVVCVEVMEFFVGAGGDDVDAGAELPMARGVRPVHDLKR